MAVTNLFVEIVFRRRLANVSQYRRPISYRLRVAPRPKPIPERVHVRIRSYARIPKQIPRPAARPATLEDRKRLIGTSHPNLRARTDPGKTRTDYEDVEMFHNRIELPINPNRL